MKKAAVLVSTMFVLGLAATGCKSDVEKAADEFCACSEKKGDDQKKCFDDVTAKYKDKVKPADTANMSDADKKASDRAQECFKKAIANH